MPRLLEISALGSDERQSGRIDARPALLILNCNIRFRSLGVARYFFSSSFIPGSRKTRNLILIQLFFFFTLHFDKLNMVLFSLFFFCSVSYHKIFGVFKYVQVNWRCIMIYSLLLVLLLLLLLVFSLLAVHHYQNVNPAPLPPVKKLFFFLSTTTYQRHIVAICAHTKNITRWQLVHQIVVVV